MHTSLHVINAFGGNYPLTRFVTLPRLREYSDEYPHPSSDYMKYTLTLEHVRAAEKAFYF